MAPLRLRLLRMVIHKLNILSDIEPSMIQLPAQKIIRMSTRLFALKEVRPSTKFRSQSSMTRSGSQILISLLNFMTQKVETSSQEMTHAAKLLSLMKISQEPLVSRKLKLEFKKVKKASISQLLELMAQMVPFTAK